MDATTRQTRKASYDAVLPKVKDRSRLILETLGSREMTVSEITDELVTAGKIPYYNRNYVAPRLSELIFVCLLFIVGEANPPISDKKREHITIAFVALVLLIIAINTIF